MKKGHDRTMKHTTTLLLGLFVGACAGASPPPPARIDAPYVLAEELADTTVALVARDPDGDVYPFCTGVWVSRFEFITAAHCATGYARRLLGLDEDAPVGTDGLKVSYFGPGEYRGVYKDPSDAFVAVLRKIDEAHDLAAFYSASVPWHRDATLAPSSPHTGAPVIMVGHPVAMYWTQTVGHVAGHYDRLLAKEGPWLQVDGVIFQGSSGGGAFDYEGRLVGIAAFTSPVPGLGFFAEVGTIRKFTR